MEAAGSTDDPGAEPRQLRERLRRAEEALRASEERYRAHVEQVRDYAIFQLDPAGVAATWNEGVHRVLGFEESEFLGIDPAPIIFTPEDLAAGLPERELREAADRGASNDDRWMRRKDGVRFWAMGITTALRDASGSLVGYIKVMRDQTDWKRAIDRLALLDAIGEATRDADDPAAVMEATTRLLGEHLRATRCAYADLEPDADRFTIRGDWTAGGAASSVGAYSLDRFGPRAAAEMRAGRTLVFRDVDAELGSGEGAETFAAITIKAIICCPLVKAGRLVAMMAVHQAAPRDWTPGEVALVRDVVDRSWAHIERVRSAAGLREADRHKDEFLATLAHELRNPLAPLRTGLEVLRRAPAGGEAAARAREAMGRQLEHMVRLVDDLLDVARIATGRIGLRKERIDLRAAVTAALEASRPLLEAAGHRLSVDLPAGPLPLEADPTRLAQVFGNLLGNAAKYTPEGGRIGLSARAEGDLLEVVVRDDGLGIPEEMQPHVFEMFAQVNRTLDRSQGGLGIGLALVRRLLEMHGGTIEVSSPGPGLGSTFTVRLPLAPPAEPARAEPEPDAGAPAARRRSVLVVDDNIDAAQSLAVLLEVMGHRPRLAHSGPQALEVAQAVRPDVVFLDIGLPGMSGYEVARRLRLDPDLHAAILVALTGWGTEDDRRKAVEAGFDLHLTKPADPASIERILARPGG